MSLLCTICDCKSFEPNIFDQKYCKGCYHKNEKHVTPEEKQKLEEEQKKKLEEERILKEKQMKEQKKNLNNSSPIQRLNISPRNSQKMPPRKTVNLSPNNNSPTNLNNPTKTVTITKKPNSPNNPPQKIPPKKPSMLAPPKTNEQRIDISMDLASKRDSSNRLTMSLDLKAESKINDRKKLLILEIIETESEYVNSLCYLLQHYLKSLQESMNHNDINLIFSNVIWIFNINSEFESELKTFKTNPHQTDLLFSILRKYVIFFFFFE